MVLDEDRLEQICTGSVQEPLISPTREERYARVALWQSKNGGECFSLADGLSSSA